MWLLLWWIVVGALFLVVHFAVLFQVARNPEPAVRWRLLALIPPFAPIVAWVGGRRIGPVAWLVVAVLYVVLRLLEPAI